MEDGDHLGILIVDDEPTTVETVEALLAPLRAATRRCMTGAEAVRACDDGFEGVVLLDIRLGAENGLELIDTLRASAPDNLIIVMSASEDLADVVTAMRAGVFDFVSKDPQTFPSRIVPSTRNALEELQRERERRRGPDSATSSASTIISRSPQMKAILADVERLGQSRVSVLIQGASGTGKEVIAHALHNTGPRRRRPFVAVNCAGIPDALLESELLGYERGAFTGAASRKLGKFEVADGGTIFLDEIGEMSLPLQAKLLRVLQDGGFERLGGNQQVRVDVRVLSATNRDLLRMVAEGTFREDLYYRLGVFTMNLPPLSMRPDDISVLVDHFLRAACQEEGRSVPDVSREVMRLFDSHPWPGNVRQLQNVVRHAVVVARSNVITIGDLPDSFKASLADPAESNAPATASSEAASVPETRTERELMQFPLVAATTPIARRLDDALEAAFPDDDVLPTMDDLESAGIRLAMKRTEGNRKQTAERLQISRATLYRRIDPVAPKGRRRSGVSHHVIDD